MTFVGATPVATRYTYEFVRRHLPPEARHLLEIGCGTGELAAQLVKDGFDVVAIDADAECVAAARKRGVNAWQVSWPARADRQFDALLFTRSLHHVADLEGSVAAARAALLPGGRMIVEDFRAEGGSERSNAWYRALTRKLATSGTFVDGFGLDGRLAAPDPDHEHELHSSSAIAEALRCFDHVECEDAAYYFRYLEGRFRDAKAAEALLADELDLIRTGSIDAFGQRFVASSVDVQ